FELMKNNSQLCSAELDSTTEGDDEIIVVLTNKDKTETMTSAFSKDKETEEDEK
ncbi:25187_t:CDS:2, partial [Gigaspora rosea]